MSEREPKVWLLQESWSQNADLSSAQRYGTVMPILSADDHPGRMPGPAIFKIRKALKGYHPDDYVAYGLADPAAPFLAGMVFARENLLHQPVNWLRWERNRDTEGERTKSGFYTPTPILYI